MTSANVVRPLVLAVSCLVLGFVGGWTLATIGGDEVALPEANVDVTVQAPAPKTESIAAPVDDVPGRDAVVVSVLNGTPRAGFAASTAKQLQELGYTNVTPGNTPTRSGPTVVYFRDGSKPAADRLAADLKTQTVTPLEGSPLETGTQPQVQLVVVLGS